MKSLLFTSFSSFRAKFGEFVQQKLGKHHGDHHQTFFFGNWQQQFREETLTLLLLLLTMLAGERERDGESTTITTPVNL
jgi:hypothetical protein